MYQPKYNHRVTKILNQLESIQTTSTQETQNWTEDAFPLLAAKPLPLLILLISCFKFTSPKFIQNKARSFQKSNLIFASAPNKNIAGRLPENSRNSFVDLQLKNSKKDRQKNSSFH